MPIRCTSFKFVQWDLVEVFARGDVAQGKGPADHLHVGREGRDLVHKRIVQSLVAQHGRQGRRA